MKRLSILLFMITIITGMGFGQAPKFFYGMASWYGEELAGKKTASGEIFDPTALTAAHKSLPFGTVVEVESLENGNKVQVIINDRGPVTGNRIIDISKKAAQELGHVDTGLFYAKLTVIKEGSGNITNDNVVTEEDTATATEVVEKDTNTTVEYEEKTIERETEITILDLKMDDADLEKEFITTEPEEDKLEPVNDLDKVVEVEDDQNIVDLDEVTPKDKEVEKTVVVEGREINIQDRDNTLVVDETRVTPELLLTNHSVIQVEKTEIDKELDIEIELPEDNDSENQQISENKQTDQGQQTDWNKTPDHKADAQGYSYAVQVGAFRKESNALKLYDRLLHKNFAVFTTEVTVNGKRYIRVRVGYFGSMSQAESVQSRIKALKLPAIILKVKLQ